MGECRGVDVLGEGGGFGVWIYVCVHFSPGNRARFLEIRGGIRWKIGNTAVSFYHVYPKRPSL